MPVSVAADFHHFIIFFKQSYDLGVSWSEPNDITLQTILKMRPNPVLLVPGKFLLVSNHSLTLCETSDIMLQCALLLNCSPG